MQEQRYRQQMIEQHHHSEELRKRDEELRKRDEELRKAHELRMSELRKENERLAELESKIDGLFSKYDINFPPVKKPEQP